MKVELNGAELACLMLPQQEAQREVARLSAEVAKLNAALAVVEAGPDAGSVNQNHLANVLVNVCGALANGNKITAIKLVREFTHLGLREAKDIVEGNYSGPGVMRVV